MSPAFKKRVSRPNPLRGRDASGSLLPTAPLAESSAVSYGWTRSRLLEEAGLTTAFGTGPPLPFFIVPRSFWPDLPTPALCALPSLLLLRHPSKSERPGAWWELLKCTLRRVPAKYIPLLCLDANARFAPHPRWPGTEDSAADNPNATCLCEVCHDFDLCGFMVSLRLLT